MRGAQRPSDLAAALGVPAATAGRMTARIADAGLVERYPDPGDGRSALVTLAPRGRLLVAHAYAGGREVFAEIINWLDPDQQRKLARAFEAFTEASGEAADLMRG